MSIENGGPAFPCDYEGSTRSDAPGMSLRDYFAAKAMQGWLASFGPEDRHPSNAGTLDMFASQAYAVADAMLAARNEHR